MRPPPSAVLCALCALCGKSSPALWLRLGRSASLRLCTASFAPRVGCRVAAGRHRVARSGRRAGFSLDARAMSATALSLDEALIDRALAGERVSEEEAGELYRLPLNELGEIANVRRNLAKRDGV